MNVIPSENTKIISLNVKDIRFPTSLQYHGSDAMHTDPDYSCAYVTIKTADNKEGNGLTFTCGRGTEIIVACVKSMSHLIVGKFAADIFGDFGTFWRSITSESQLRWIGPEKGVIHLATAAIINSLWDLWAKLVDKPLWQLLYEMEPEQLISAMDFRYVTDVLTKDEALQMLKDLKKGHEDRLNHLKENGYPAYTTQIGWLGYSDDVLIKQCEKYMSLGFQAFKVKVGSNLQRDIERLKLVRSIIGWNNLLMIDANQVWDVNQAIEWLHHLAQFKVTWIEEPTSPDDILGHARIAEAMRPLGMGVATGEMCANRVMFKQLMQANAIQYCQIDAARVGGINELLVVYMMAHKFGVKVCPHAGGIGLCEMVQHLQMWDYLSLSGTDEGRYIEYVDEQHEHFTTPLEIYKGRYQMPTAPGYSTTLKTKAIDKFSYPLGTEWQKLFLEKKFPRPT